VSATAEAPAHEATVRASVAGGNLEVTLAGDWTLGNALPPTDAVRAQLAQSPRPASIRFDTRGLGAWDSGLVTRLIAWHRDATAADIAFDDSGLPDGARRLIALAFAVKAREGTARTQARSHPLAELGEQAMEAWREFVALVDFIGAAAIAVHRFAVGRAKYLRSDVVQHVQEAGVEALPIVSLISFLIGMIFAFVGVMQLRAFGAGIYTADLVAIAMVREMAPIMTAIIMAGRTGAAYAAEIGTMKVNEEIDALTTLGIDPMDFLVIPRMFALVLMIPLLTLYASLLGIIGGTVVGLSMLDVTLVQYVHETIGAVDHSALFGGLFKCIVYGALVALAGCQQGIECGKSAMAVGQATTRAVVMGIVSIVVSASVLTVIYINLGI